MPISLHRHVLVATSALLVFAGCSESVTEPEVEQVVTFTVNASVDTSYVALGSTVTPLTVTTPRASTAWDLGFYATTVKVNGGAGGPGGVKAYCICQNNVAAMTPEQISAMTPESELADFDAVTAANIPATAAAWEVGADDIRGAFGPAAQQWYKYRITPDDHTIYPTYQVYLIKRGNDVYKLQVTGYYGPAGETRRITFRYAELT